MSTSFESDDTPIPSSRDQPRTSPRYTSYDVDEDQGEGLRLHEEDPEEGVKLGAAFFGWLTASAMMVLLSLLLAGFGAALWVAVGTSSAQLTERAQTDPRASALIAGTVLSLLVLISYYCGGYVAGRMTRSAGAAQGLAVWGWALLGALLLAIAALMVASQYDVRSAVESLPAVDLLAGRTREVALAALAIAVIGSLVGALVGGSVGGRYHRLIDQTRMRP